MFHQLLVTLAAVLAAVAAVALAAPPPHCHARGGCFGAVPPLDAPAVEPVHKPRCTARQWLLGAPGGLSKPATASARALGADGQVVRTLLHQGPHPCLQAAAAAAGGAEAPHAASARAALAISERHHSAQAEAEGYRAALQLALDTRVPSVAGLKTH